MKKIFYLLGAILGTALIFHGCNNSSNKTTIKGKIDGLNENDSLLVYCLDKKDTIAAPNGVFEYEYTDSTVSLIHVIPLPKKQKDGSQKAVRMQYLRVLAMPGKSLEIKGNFDNYTITGAKVYEEYNQFKEDNSELFNKLRSLQKEYLDTFKNEKTEENKALQDSLRVILTDLNGQTIETYKDYISNHLDSDASLFMIYTMGQIDGEEYLPKFSDNVKNGELKQIYTTLVDFYAKKAAKKEAAKKIKEGEMAPDFTLKDIKGNDFTLSSLRGKYVVLDFWGSWCGWCIKGMPDMAKVYKKYNGKLEIVGINCSDTEAKWKAAVKKHNMSWINVVNSTEKENDLTTIYNISGYPTKFILSPEGEILKIVVGESPEFYKALKELIK